MSEVRRNTEKSGVGEVRPSGDLHSPKGDTPTPLGVRKEIRCDAKTGDTCLFITGPDKTIVVNIFASGNICISGYSRTGEWVDLQARESTVRGVYLMESPEVPS